MANHCENVMRVSGNAEELLKFDIQFRGDNDESYHFDNLYPTPKGLNICDVCDWRKKHWSVKGNFYEDSFDCDKVHGDMTEAYYYFDTPWVGPEKLMQYISKKYKGLEFMLVFSELGNGVRGLCVYSGGNIISEEKLSDADIEYWFGVDEKAERGA